jgi:hypothetical protein
MTTQQIADRLVELCRQGKFLEAQQELFAPNAVSDEPKGSPMEHAEGLEALAQKAKMFQDNTEAVHGMTIGDPIVAGNAFACTMSMDITMKERGRMQMDEVCLYQVKDGKIVSERFAW